MHEQPDQTTDARDEAGCCARIEHVRRGPWIQFAAPHRFGWQRAELPIVGLGAPLSGLRIIHLSDLHFRTRWYASHDELVERVNASRSDLILMTGDLVDDKRNHRKGLPQVLRLLSGLRARLGVFTILGNHDGPFIAPSLNVNSTRMIDSQRVIVKVGGDSAPGGGGSEIELIGLPGLTRQELGEGFLRRLPPRTPGVPRIVLSHYPDHIRRLERVRPDLYLTGHTHGGQLCLPGGVPLVRHDSLPRAMCRGVHRCGSTWLVVSPGLGFSSPLPLRLFSATEVIEIVLRDAAG